MEALVCELSIPELKIESLSFCRLKIYIYMNGTTQPYEDNYVAHLIKKVDLNILDGE